MKHIKAYKVFESIKPFKEVNFEILNTIDILTSLTEDLQQLGFIEGFTDKRPIQVYARCSGQRYDLIGFGKFVNENIDKDISTIEWTLSGNAKDLDDKEFDLVIDEFVNKLTEFAPNCRINNLKREFNKSYNMVYNKGKYDKSDKCDATITLSLVDPKKTRYLNETSKEI